jgi:hypothetical protein
MKEEIMRARVWIASAVTLTLFLSTTPVGARTIRQRAENQEERIERGEDNGRLTPRESNRLENEQQTIDAERRRALEDGRVTRGERREIRHDQRAASRDIRRKKHNARRD